MKYIFGALAGACLFAPYANATTPAGNTLYVANNGFDTGTCGAVETPCRTITQGIANALEGDTLIVKPGLYGELDGTASIDYVGEETGVTAPWIQGAVYVNKRLTILSSEGADATVIDLGNATNAAVEIAADGVRFGDKGHGFTLTGGQQFGLYSHGNDVVIVGNVARGQSFAGFRVDSTGISELRQNTAVANPGMGIMVLGSSPANYVVVSNNVAAGNGNGIVVGVLSPHRITGNVISDNEIGINMNYGGSRIAQNQIVNNRHAVQLNGWSEGDEQGRPVLTRNNILGNFNNGIIIYPGPPGITPRIRENNFMGNYGCAVNNSLNESTLDARNNYWGSPTGPGFIDPANEACAFGPHPIVTTPFATTEFEVR